MSHYARATDIFAAALDLPVEDRPAFVVQQSNGDAVLEQEVLSLLGAHAKSESFLETPAHIEHAGLLDDGRMDGIPATIGPYRIAGVLGEGGMGVVYLAEDTRLGRTVALKAIAPQFTHDEHWRERLRREARAAAALVHPGIAVVYALEEIDAQLFIVSEHIQGETLRDAIANGPLTLGDALSIGHRLADALAAAHDAGVIHRDLKPENVMRTRDGAVKILDFGLAKIAQGPDGHGPVLTLAGGVFGTPAYMSPEQLRGEVASPASDIFALGVVLAELSSGRHPFGGEHGTSTMARALSAEPDLAAVPLALQPVIAGCLAKNAADRFRSAHEVRAAIDAVTRGEMPPRIDHAAEFWWWQFHQAGACLFSAVLIVGVWLSFPELSSNFAEMVLVTAVVGGAVAATLRLYNWFSARMNPRESTSWQSSVGARIGDGLLALAAFFAGFPQMARRPVAAGLLMASAIVMLVISIVIEPATARAAKRH